MELADMIDSKSIAEKRKGSNPFGRTIYSHVTVVTQ